ncbi:outer membrane lipoprotein carrier protein LolA [Massilia sp. YIM B02763]|uniref:outer membrane lipoprotein carrier protein LolA n=1 Tax=Massilia sp. YIM B02763 TaxID=3050130 RepID=UPI0025B64F81|nr:outer membrane lipoprotein carrier protein LolA [Massilia sp. YIM B02763]MDN4051872.1 outer membrane lipoprotein carrier protein LolA [Massilia sp. YIM B02763]
MKHLIAGLLAAACLSAQAAAPVATIQAMLAKPDQLCGRFDQSKQLAGMKKPLASSGKFCVVAGKGVLWRTLKPFANTLRLTRDEIVQTQGERVAMRLEASREPTVRMINGVLFSLLSGDLHQLESLFEVDGSVSGDTWKVSLKARNAALARAVGTISLDGGAYVRTIRMVEESGDRTDIRFLDIKTGAGAVLPEEAAQL